MSWQQKLKDSTYQRVARKAGVRNLDSQNDVRKIAAYIASNPGLSQQKYISNAKAAGVNVLDSANDIAKIDKYLGSSTPPPGNEPPPQVTPGPKNPTPEPKPGAAPTPQPAATTQPAVDYSSIFQGYQDTISNLTASYTAAIANSNTIASSNKTNQENADKVGNLEQENESLKQENQRFLDASANSQLSALRSGTTTGGDNSSVYGSRGEGLSSGTTQYQPSSKKSSIDSDTPVENSVLSRKGPVVQQLNTALSRQKGAPARPNSGLASGRSSSYYATRFS